MAVKKEAPKPPRKTKEKDGVPNMKEILEADEEVCKLTYHQKLVAIQSELKAKKNNFNKFGNYNYRSCEDILEAVKPLLKKYDLVLLLTDSIVPVPMEHTVQSGANDSTSSAGRIYVQATAMLSDGKDSTTVNALAREPESKKGMDSSQVTGAASSYARKYALNGLFCIDDTKDADGMDNTEPEKKVEKKVIQPKKLIKGGL